MFEYISGNVSELTPAYAVLDVQGIGYFIRITVYTYEQMVNKNPVKLYVEPVYRDDGQFLYGFAGKKERTFFRQLMAVSGIGATSALSILSAIEPDELARAIVEENISVLKSVKGIGPKTAKRIIVELKDKIIKEWAPGATPDVPAADRQSAEQAVAALEVLGYPRRLTEKTVLQILREQGDLNVESIIKLALKRL